MRTALCTPHQRRGFGKLGRLSDVFYLCVIKSVIEFYAGQKIVPNLYYYHVGTNEGAYCKQGDIISDVINRIILSNTSEEASSGDEKDAVMSPTDTNTDSSKSELEYLLDYPPSR